MEITVIIPTHNPDMGRLWRTLTGLRAQTLPVGQWETLMVDNASVPALEVELVREFAPANLRLVREPQLGLTAARRRGFTEARAPLCVLVDDDNVLAPDYLTQVIRLFGAHPRIGAIGGKSLPEFEAEPPDWVREFLPLLALRDLGDKSCISEGLRPPGAMRNQYPAEAAPIGAGMAVRREAVAHWLAGSASSTLSDRRGAELTSGGDNDIVLTVMTQGWEVAYFPELTLTHLIPASRLTADYLSRLNHGIQKSWMQVLTKHEANPWPPIPCWTIPLRQCKAWFTNQAWRSHVARIRWRGVCGHFAGRATD